MRSYEQMTRDELLEELVRRDAEAARTVKNGGQSPPTPALQASLPAPEAILQAVMSGFDGFVYICSPDYRVLFHNDAMRERIGYDAVGHFCYRALHERSSICPWCVNERVYAGETVRIVAKSPKDNHWFDVSSIPIWQEGVVTAKVGMFMDITDRKKADDALRASEAQVRKRSAQLESRNAMLDEEIKERKRTEEAIIALNASLDQRVRERTAELESAIREQESFSYSVSHDLRAPLRHINSFSAILIEEFGIDLPVEARSYLGRIVDATTKMGVLIDRLLDLSRVARTEMNRDVVDLSAQAAAILALLVEAEPQRPVELSIEEGLLVQGDPALLNQMLEHLLQNAWKYSSQKSSARIDIGKTVAAGQEAFFVRDNGAGFDMAYSDKLFSIFQRIHGNEFEGTGIGLATAQKIIKRHGGAIWAESRVDEGATFYFTVP